MLGYRIPGNPIEMGMKDQYITEWLLEESFAISAQYVPDMPVKLSSSCCSGNDQRKRVSGRNGTGKAHEQGVGSLALPSTLDLVPHAHKRRLPLVLGGRLPRDRLL